MTCPRCAVPWSHLHVTEALSLGGLVDATWFTDEARTRGIYVHEGARLADLGILDRESLDPVLIPYMDAYRRFVEQARPRWGLIEYPIEDRTLGYVGRLDRANDTTICDIKTGAPQWWVAVQCAAYRRCLPGAYNRKQFVLELRDDGTYRYTPTAEISGLSDREAERLWLSVLHVAQARKAH